MRQLIHIISFEWKILWRSNLLKTILLVIIGAGIYGIYFGKFEVKKQANRISQIQHFERQQYDSLMHWVQLDTTIAVNKEKYRKAVTPTGVNWKRHFIFYQTNEPSAVSGLCLGQMDLFPVYYGINATDLTRKLNAGELANPMKLLTGSFDLSYVFVFLFPLLVVALLYDLYSGEKENGTLSLLMSQSISLRKILFGKWLLRLLIVWSLAALILITAFVLQGVGLAENINLFGQWLSIIFGYLLLWTLVMAFIVWLRRRSAFNAMVGLGVWLFFTLIAPALLNLFVLVDEPLPNRAEVVNVVRELNDEQWKQPKSFVLDKFYQDYPEYKDGDTVDFYKWYYAGFTLLDKKANALKAEFESQVKRRNELLDQWQWLAPAAMVHEKLSTLSGTDRGSHLKFLQEVHNSHDHMKSIYYDKIFSKEQFTKKDLQAMEKFL